MRENEDIIYFRTREDINKIIKILKKYSYSQLIKTAYFRLSLIEKNTEEDFLKKCYSEFERIKFIALRKRLKKKSNYDIYYELDKEMLFSLP